MSSGEPLVPPSPIEALEVSLGVSSTTRKYYQPTDIARLRKIATDEGLAHDFPRQFAVVGYLHIENDQPLIRKRRFHSPRGFFSIGHTYTRKELVARYECRLTETKDGDPNTGIPIEVVLDRSYWDPHSADRNGNQWSAKFSDFHGEPVLILGRMDRRAPDTRPQFWIRIMIPLTEDQAAQVLHSGEANG